MKDMRWSQLKSERLKRTRGVSFEEIISSQLIAVKSHPKRSGQNIMLFKLKGYIWIVPYVEEKDYIFLKTLYPSRKFTKLYRKGELK
ncbi:MAG: toxin [Candidatus Omnitrophota bacterium]|nr:toxin [Candidatus Omnitrophota bacterium]